MIKKKKPLSTNLKTKIMLKAVQQMSSIRMKPIAKLSFQFGIRTQFYRSSRRHSPLVFNDTVIVQPEFRQKLDNAKTKQSHFNADFLESSCFYVTCVYLF